MKANRLLTIGTRNFNIGGFLKIKLFKIAYFKFRDKKEKL